MPLSLDKLHSIINSQGLIPTTHYVYKKSYRIIQAISVKNRESVLIYIPRSYDFRCSGSDDVTYYKLKKLDITIVNSIVDDYGSQKNTDLNYPDLDIDHTKVAHKGDIEKSLLDNYQRPVIINDIDDKDLVDVKTIYRQLHRLRNTVKFIQYKLGIVSNSYACIVNDKDDIETYFIKGLEKDGKKRLYVTLSLQTLIVNEGSIEFNVKEVQTGLRNLLDRNKTIHSEKLSRLLARKTELYNSIGTLEHLKMKSISMVEEYDKLLKITEAEIEQIEKSVATTRNDASGLSLPQREAERLGTVSRLEERLKTINEKRDQIQVNILKLEDYISNITLHIDQILFDNIVLLDTMYKNMDNLLSLLK
jgi:hypothetical protein